MPHKLKEGVEVLLHVAVLVADDVAPLHHHVVQRYVGVVQRRLLEVRQPVVEVPQQQVQVRELVPHPVQRVRLVDEQVLQLLRVFGQRFVQRLRPAQELVDLLHVRFALRA